MPTPTIRDLWRGNISESEHMPISPEYRRADHAAERVRNRLEQHLSEQQKELLNGYTEAMYHLGIVYAEDAYARGFTLGLHLACEALSG